MVRANRHNQRLRTRKALLAAVRDLMAAGDHPSMEDVADRALVSRATAYRYFANIQALILEAGLDAAVPRPEEVFPEPAGEADLVPRLGRVPEVLIGLTRAQEVNFRRFLSANLLESASKLDDGQPQPHFRGGRRMGLLERALAGANLSEARKKRIMEMAALVVGPELFISAVDSCQMDRDEVLPAAHWLIDAIVAKAMRE